MKFIRTYILSYDTATASVLTILCIYFAPTRIDVELASTLLDMGIGVLSITFSIFFAALAFIISASDDDFVKFLEEEKLFTSIINSFKFTVGSLFCALIYSIIIFVIITFGKSSGDFKSIPELYIALFCFLFFYSLVATIISTNDAIRYSKARVKFIKLKPVKDVGK